MGRVWKEGRIYYAQWKDHNGKWVKRSTNFTDRVAALRKLADWERIAADPTRAAAHAETFERALQLMIADRELRHKMGTMAAATVTFYRKKSGHLLRVFGVDARLSDVDANSVDQYIAQRFDEGAKRHTITKELNALRVTLKLAKRRGHYPLAIEEVMPVGWSSGYRPGKRSISHEDARALMAALPPRKRAWVGFVLATGASASEAAAALPEDIDRDKGLVLLRGEKRETRWRSVPILPWTAHYLDGVELPLVQWLDSNRGRDLAKACERIGIEPVVIRDLRRTAGTWLREMVGSGGLVGLYLGHSDASMADKVYARLEGERLRRAILAAAGPDISRTRDNAAHRNHAENGKASGDADA